jgi:hypothetical protein
MKSLADDLASSINSVVIMGDGSQKLIKLANSTLSGREYNITVRKNTVLLQWANVSDVASRFLTTRINTTKFNLTLSNMTNITVDEVRLLPGDIMIWKDNGTIFMQNVQV